MYCTLYLPPQLLEHVPRSDVEQRILPRIRHALDRFSTRIASTQVSIRDLNGPKGGIDLECQIHLLLCSGERVVVGAVGELLENAVTGATEKAQRALTRHKERKTGRRRLKSKIPMPVFN